MRHKKFSFFGYLVIIPMLAAGAKCSSRDFSVPQTKKYTMGDPTIRLDTDAACNGVYYDPNDAMAALTNLNDGFHGVEVVPTDVRMTFLSDFTFSDELDINPQVHLTIDMNGHTATFIPNHNNPAIVATESDSSLHIVDESEAGNGKLSAKCEAVYATDCEFIMESGTLETYYDELNFDIGALVIDDVIASTSYISGGRLIGGNSFALIVDNHKDYTYSEVIPNTLKIKGNPYFDGYISLSSAACKNRSDPNAVMHGYQHSNLELIGALDDDFHLGKIMVELGGPMEGYIKDNEYEVGMILGWNTYMAGKKLSDYFVSGNNGYRLMMNGDIAVLDTYSITTQPTTSSKTVSVNYPEDVVSYEWCSAISTDILLTDATENVTTAGYPYSDGKWHCEGDTLILIYNGISEGDYFIVDFSDSIILDTDFVLDEFTQNEADELSDGVYRVEPTKYGDDYYLYILSSIDGGHAACDIYVHQSELTPVAGETTNTLHYYQKGEHVCKMTMINGTVMISNAVNSPKGIYNMSGITFTDAEYDYDGQPHTLTINGTLPTGVTVNYTTNTLTDAGQVVVTASFTGDSENYEAIPDMTATLKIKGKSTYDMSGVKFEDKTYLYDGKPHSLEISGNLPQGVTVNYSTNTLTDVGEIEVTASFTGDSENYNAIPSMKATLKIVSSSFTTAGEPGVEKNVSVSLDIPATGEYKETFDPSKDIDIVVKVTVEANVVASIEQGKTIVNYNDLPENVKLNDDEEIGIIYNVKLIQIIDGVQHEIQPSDIKDGTKIKVIMDIPSDMDVSKITKILHVHAENDIEEIAFDASKVVDGKYEITIDRLSEFAFIYTKPVEPRLPSECFIHFIVIGLLVALIAYSLIMYFLKKKFEMNILNICVCGALILASIVTGIIGGVLNACIYCYLLLGANVLVGGLGVLQYLLLKNLKKENVKKE